MAKPDPVMPSEAPQRRPFDMSEEELGFRPQRAVRWLQPGVLIASAAQSLVAEILGSLVDSRELQASLQAVLPATVHRYAGSNELWLDYVADLGDGFDATYSIASLLGAETVELDGTAPLPRGKLLIMGGDQVYPDASVRAYEDRCRGVYRAALPSQQGHPPPTLFALPGNNDWYDGLTAFLQVFAQRRPFGAWRTEQTRSYFAIMLPQRWWLFAIDTHFEDHVDSPQLEYFREVSKELRRGDAIILCVSTPAWVPAGSGGKSTGYDTLEFFNREIVRPRGASIRLMLSGDKHHYARYAERDGAGQLITSGLGGAYLTATHGLPRQLELPPRRSRARHTSVTTRYDLAGRYPNAAESRMLATGIFQLPWRNPGFWALTGILQTVMSLAVLRGLAGTGTGLFQQLAAWAPAAIVAVVLVLAAIAFARFDTPVSSETVAFAGVLHAVVHIALSVAWAAFVLWLYQDLLPTGPVADSVVFSTVAIGTPVLIGFLDAELVALYLLLASRFGINVNEAFAGQSIEDHKGFLRLHIGADGSLTVYPIKLAKVCRFWKVDPAGAPNDPWLRPSGIRLLPDLIESPIVIPRASSWRASR